MGDCVSLLMQVCTPSGRQWAQSLTNQHGTLLKTLNHLFLLLNSCDHRIINYLYQCYIPRIITINGLNKISYIQDQDRQWRGDFFAVTWFSCNICQQGHVKWTPRRSINFWNFSVTKFQLLQHEIMFSVVSTNYSQSKSFSTLEIK